MKKGFSLVELLAAIVILIIILSIVIPVILNVINNAQKNSFVLSIHGLIKTAKMSYHDNMIRNQLIKIEYIFSDGNVTIYENDQISTKKLKASGNLPKNGFVTVNLDGSIIVQVTNGFWCVKKEATSTTLQVEENINCLEEETGLYARETILCLLFDTCSGVEVPQEYIGTEGTWYPLSSFNDLLQIDRDQNYTFALETEYEKEVGLGSKMNRKYILVEDINLNDQLIEPIGHGTGWQNEKFSGVIEGNNQLIENFKIENPTDNYVSLFAFLDGAEIRNLFIENVVTTGHTHVGGLAGRAENSIIENAHIFGHITSPTNVSGGTGILLGSSINTTITNSSAKGIVNGTSNTGSLVGNMSDSNIINCYFDAEVNGSNTRTGGLIGRSVDSNIQDSYGIGTITGTVNVGGIAGEISGGTVNRTYFNGSLAATDRLGGIVGGTYNFGLITNSYAYDIEITRISGSGIHFGRIRGTTWDNTSQNNYGLNVTMIDNFKTITSDINGVDGLTLSNIPSQSHYHVSGWDFSNIWFINSDRPNLKWQQ